MDSITAKNKKKGFLPFQLAIYKSTNEATKKKKLTFQKQFICALTQLKHVEGNAMHVDICTDQMNFIANHNLDSDRK